jgi:probable rRNA maturation factor
MIEINNLTKGRPLGRVDKKVFSTVAKIVLKGENRETETLSLAFVNKEEIKKFNKKFRGKNKPTDVLSFLLNEKQCFGEIIICPEVVKENAKKYGVSAKREIMKVFVHGILHLCGYDHEKSEKEAKIMEDKQNFYLSKNKI